jgi:hypothetical protein
VTTRSWRALAASLVTATLASPTLEARPGSRDPTVPRRLVVGAPAGFWPMQRGDGARTGRTPTSFPTVPFVTKRIPLFADLAAGPVVDAHEHLVVATKDGKLVEILPSGAVAFTLTLDAPVVLGPVITSDGTRVVVTRDSVALGVAPDGSSTFTTPLGASRAPVLAEPLATRDSAVVVAFGSHLTKLGSDGELRAEAELDENVVAITETARALYVATETGRVFEWAPPETPRPVGNLGGKPTSELVAMDDGRLVAAIRAASLVEIGTRDGTRATLAALAPDTITDTPAVTPSGELRLTTRAGWLLGYASSRETLRHAMIPSTTLPAFVYADASLPPLVDRAGAVAFVTPSATVGVLLPTGEVHTTPLSECGPPIAFVPSGKTRLAVFCRSGFIALVGEAPGTPMADRPAPPSRFP